MGLRNTFQAVIQMVRAESRLSTNTSRGIDHLDHIKQLIRRNVQQLAEDYEWQHLALKKESAVSRVVLQAGLRTYAFPAAVNPAKIAQGWVKWGNLWQRVDYGITLDHFSALDPDTNQRSDPVRNWMFYSDIEFEVWPLPASNGVANGSGEFAFEGQRKPDTLLQDGDRVDMDDILVSLLSATEILAADGQKAAADVKGNAAAARLLQVRGNFGSKTRYTIGLGKIGEAPYYPRHPEFIRKSH
jgi:hypothetical protein